MFYIHLASESVTCMYSPALGKLIRIFSFIPGSDEKWKKWLQKQVGFNRKRFLGFGPNISHSNLTGIPFSFIFFLKM